MSRPTKRKSNAVTKAPKAKKIPKTENKFVADEGLNKEPGSVLVIGEGIAGQLGLGIDISEKSKPAVVPDLNNVVEIAAGGMHSICLTADSKVITFGCNDEGALGRDTSEEGTEAIPGEVELPGKVIQVSAGDSHSTALLDNGQVYIWGTFRDEHGSMGLLKNDAIEKKPVLLESKVRFLRVASGSNHIVLLDENKHVNTFGCGEQGQLGRLSERASSRDSRKGLGQLLTPAIVPFKNRPKFEIVDIWAGNMCTFIKDNKELIHVFGLNNYKQLGVEKGRIMFHPIQSTSFNDRNWIKVAIGQHHTIALDSEDRQDPFDPFEGKKLHQSEKSNDESNRDPFGCEPFGAPAPALPPKNKQPPPRPAPPRPSVPPSHNQASDSFADFSNFNSKGSQLEFTEDPFKDYRYEDIFNIEDPFVEAADKKSNTVFPDNDPFSLGASNQSNVNNNTKCKSTEILADANDNKIHSEDELKEMKFNKSDSLPNLLS